MTVSGAERHGWRPASGLIVQQTTSGGITVLLAAVLGLISLRASNPWLLLVSCALLAPVVISQVLRPDLRSISICFNSSDRVAVGDSMQQIFHVHNRGRRSSPDLQLSHALQCFPSIMLAVPALPPGGRADLTILRTAASRGVATVHDLQLQTIAPFGMALHRWKFSTVARINVHPALGPVGLLPGGAAGQLVGGRPTRFGHEPHELREWRRGDSLRQVHWRATARHNRLTVVIPEITIHAQFALVIAGSAQDESWEELISTAAWTAVDAARAGRSVLISAAGTPDYTGDDPAAILDWFAALGPVDVPGPALLEAAEQWVGSSGSVVVASTRQTVGSLMDSAFGIARLHPSGQVTQ
jgi:uncharacterized protein (DUF58 family)